MRLVYSCEWGPGYPVKIVETEEVVSWIDYIIEPLGSEADS